ncbi:hypothetical protein RUM44_009399 [Polyplax serrata]|uniref:Uncharacterized protein n=1 Tax=Polyplax serrata TaxID=468196 RepID=A0ABR1ASK8_POLSC
MTENSEEDSEDSLDNETGEKKTKIVCSNIQRCNTNAETGEPETFDIIVKRKSFQIPLKYLKEPLENCGFKPKGRRRFVPEWYVKKNQFKSGVVKTIFLSNGRNVSPLVFVLPTLLIFPTWASILCLLWEACMHIWSHQRNKWKKNHHVEYRSPLHLLSSQFCIHCRSRKWKEKISEIHKKRTLRRRNRNQKYQKQKRMFAA